MLFLVIINFMQRQNNTISCYICIFEHIFQNEYFGFLSLIVLSQNM